MLPMPSLHRAFPDAHATYASHAVQMRLLFFLNHRTNFFSAMIQVSKNVTSGKCARVNLDHGIQQSLNAIQFGHASELM